MARIFVQASAIELAHIAERTENLKAIFVQASAIELAHIAERSRKSQSNFRESERRAELVRAMPSAAEFSCKRVQ